MFWKFVVTYQVRSTEYSLRLHGILVVLSLGALTLKAFKLKLIGSRLLRLRTTHRSVPSWRHSISLWGFVKLVIYPAQI